jgi:dolichyl-diphosphooligosaccharide--protein glycosyltransferase
MRFAVGTVREIYEKGVEFIGPMPEWSRDWKRVGIYGACIYLVVLAFRISFQGRWDHPELWVAGERILATHDAYYWLAKAKGVGILAGYPLAQLAAFVHELTGIGYGAIGFWGPAVFGALVGVICFLWGWLLAGANAGVLAGLIGSLTPGFFYRSRLGYFDTDMFTLLMPMFIAWMLAFWMSGLIREGWLPGSGESRRPSKKVQLWMAFAFGLATRVACLWHTDIVNIAVIYIALAFMAALVLGLPDRRATAFQGLTVFILTSMPGSFFGSITLWPLSLVPSYKFGVPYIYYITTVSTLVAAICVVMFSRAEGKKSYLNKPLVCMAILFLVVLSTNLIGNTAHYAFAKVFDYLKGAGSQVPAQTGSAAMGPIYPSILQSIIEVRLAPLAEVMERGLFAPWLCWLALAATAVVAVLRPTAVFLLPMIALQMASVVLGIRFSMFGGAALAVMLGVGLYWLFGIVSSRFDHKALLDFAVQALLGAGFLFYCHSMYSTIPLTPVVPRQHAEALIELGRASEPDSMVWTWWDWGYATQYYAERETMADGGKHAGREVFPVAFVLASPSPHKANRMVAFSAQHPEKSRQRTGLSPAAVWDAIPRSEVSAALDEQLSREDYPPAPPQYVVVTWKDLSLAKWISYFGNWNLATGMTEEAKVKVFDPGELGFNVQRGAVMSRQGGGGLVSDMTLLDASGVDRKSYFMNTLSPQLLPKTQHLYINMVSKQSVILDRIARESTMTRLLTGDPDDPEIAPYFKLVVDRLPFARVYEVVQ